MKDLTQEIPDIKAAISCQIKAGDHLKVVWAPKVADDFPKLYKLAKIENHRAHKGGRTLVYVCMAESMGVIFFSLNYQICHAKVKRATPFPRASIWLDLRSETSFSWTLPTYFEVRVHPLQHVNITFSILCVHMM